MYLKPHILKLKADLAKKEKNLIRLPAKPKKLRRHEESDIQQSIIQYAQIFRFMWDGQIIRLSDYLISNPNGGKRNIIEATRLKREGTKAGVSDLFLTIPSKSYHGMWIEVKTAKGKMSDKQLDWFEKQAYMGYKCEIVRSIDDFIKIINDYLY